MKEIVVNNPEDLHHAAQKILETVNSKSRIFLFDAVMGAGKTTFIKALCRYLGVQENVSSPTFSIVNEYRGIDGPVYHFDFYRIKDEKEAYDLGYEEYFYSGHYCFIEWPQKISNLIPDDALSVKIEVTGSETRIIKLLD
ncbi:tRNA (adenosine(37)-N6)-threonylcarbamoyltransferase complex ATPase subunit type 1 TsaE [Albibacterium profundi]|uniref:tRNA threonylcarbamoyladenosine biosynthesis protein TsaE n=1 Tax=Albibacterium profundi TaxID=3134906 RepID=A0ABV5CGT4_9SPHI